MALALGRDLLKPLDGTQLRVAVDSALTKITSALPPSGLEFARQMREFFSVGLGPQKTYARHREVVERLSRAVAEHRTVQMRYYSVAGPGHQARGGPLPSSGSPPAACT